MTVTTKPLGDSVGVEMLGVDRERLLHDEAWPTSACSSWTATGCSCSVISTSTTTTQVAFSRSLGPVEGFGRRDDGAEIFRVTSIRPRTRPPPTSGAPSTGTSTA